MIKIIAERYEIIELIGQGGMADVYLAKDIILDRTIAVKVLRTSLAKDPMYVMRFQREANAVASITDKNIVEIYDVGEDNGTYYIVMEYVPGVTLKELIVRRGAVHVAEAIDIIKQVASGITRAHEAGIIHRDLKPQNILVTESGVAKIADFGIASMDSLAQVTQTDMIMGSLHYLAPEIARGEKATGQSDIYALGIVLYELLRGEVPFKGESPVNIAMKHMQEDVPSIRAFNQTILQSVENIIICATAKNLNNRYKSAKEMLGDLADCLERKNVKKIEFIYNINNDPTIIVDEESTAMMKAQAMINSSNNQYEDEDEEYYDEDDEYYDEDDNGGIYLFGREFSRNSVIVMAVIGLLAVCGLVFAFTRDNTPIIEVPNVIGCEVDEATEILEEAGFIVVDKIVEVASEDVEPGLVIETDPETGEMIKEGSEVTLYVSIGEMIILDDYVGEHIDDVKETLELLGFTVIVIEETDNNEPGTILEQSVEPGTEFLPDNSVKVIKLTVSSGKDIIVGDYIGLTQEEAESLLSSLGFVVTIKEENSEEEAGTVIEQNRDAGTIYKQGDTLTIILTVSIGLEIEVPNVVGMVPSDAVKILVEKGFEVIYTDLGYAPTPGDVNSVIMQYPSAFTIVQTSGTTVEIRYYSSYIAPDVELPGGDGNVE